MGACLQRRRRLVEADVTVRANAEDLDVDASGGGNLALVARALRLGIGGRSIQEVNALGRKIDAAEEVRVHETAEAAGVPGGDPDELIEVERRRLGQVGLAPLHA